MNPLCINFHYGTLARKDDVCPLCGLTKEYKQPTKQDYKPDPSKVY